MLHPDKSAQLDYLRQSFETATSAKERLQVIAGTVSMLGLDCEPLAQENASKGFPCPLLRLCSVVLASLC
jgi:hypothetical protein